MTEKLSESDFLKSLDALETLIAGVPELDGDLSKAEKGSTDEGDEDTDEDEQEDKDEKEDDKPAFAKKAASDSDEIKKAVEVSDFLADLVGKVGEAIDQIRESVDTRLSTIEAAMEKSQAFNEQFVDALKKSFVAVSENATEQTDSLMKSIADVSADLGTQPARARKAKTTILEKSFSNDVEKQSMSKNDILKSMVSAIEAGDKDITASDVIRYESGGPLSPRVITKLGLK